MIQILINIDWLFAIIPVALAAGFVLGLLWTGRQHGRGEHSFYGDEVSAFRVGQNAPRLTVAQCQERARRKRKPAVPLVLARSFGKRTPTTRLRLTA